MIAAVESPRTAGLGLLRGGDTRAAEWEEIVAMHRRDDWPPPGWAVRTEQAPEAPVAEAEAA